MSIQPLVSVILPTYNRGQTLARAMQSVLWQSYRELELIVVDDGSIDATPQIVAAFNDERVRYINQGANRGAAAARNAGIAMSRGEILAFQDSDDEWVVDKLEKQVSVLLQAGTDIGLALCGLLCWDSLQVGYLPGSGRHGAREHDIRREILSHNYALTPGWCLRRVHFEQIGPFDEALPPLEDWEWLIRYTGRFKATLVDEPLVVVYESTDSISKNQEKYIVALEGIIAKHSTSLTQDPVSLANLHYVLGKKHILYGCPRKGRLSFMRALRSHPWDARIWVAFALSVAGPGVFTAAWRFVRRRKGHTVK